jgi:hypothetical protein
MAPDLNRLLFCPIDIDIPFRLDFEIRNEVNNPEGASFWKSDHLLDKISYNDQPASWKELSGDKQIYKKIINSLPFIDLHHVRLSVQDRPVLAHVDVAKENYSDNDYQKYLELEPCGYRLVISGSKDSLYVINGKPIQTILPKIPCLYVINSTTCQHFVSGDIGRKVLYVRGLLDKNKHHSLLNRSLEKYNEYAIWKEV